MSRLEDEVVFITGASSGIGAACARSFARLGCRLALIARRGERLATLVEELESLGAHEILPLVLDVRQQTRVQRTIEQLPDSWRQVEILVNNAGLSRGLSGLHEGELQDWEEMIDTNIKGLLYIDRAIVPTMVRRGRGSVIHIGSIAGHQVYRGGNVYCATKHAVRALSDGLRIDLLGSGVRVMSIDPGMVETEFSRVRFHGDEERAAAVYRDTTPLRAEDVADVIVFAATRPAHVNLAQVWVLPTDQASATDVFRRG